MLEQQCFSVTAIKSFLQGGNAVPPLPHRPHQEKDACASPLVTQNESTKTSGCTTTFWLDSLLTLRAGNECVKPEGQRGLACVPVYSQQSFWLGRKGVPQASHSKTQRIHSNQNLHGILLCLSLTAWPIYCGCWQKEPLGFGFKNPFLILQVKLGSPDS